MTLARISALCTAGDVRRRDERHHLGVGAGSLAEVAVEIDRAGHAATLPRSPRGPQGILRARTSRSAPTTARYPKAAMTATPTSSIADPARRRSVPAAVRPRSPAPIPPVATAVEKYARTRPKSARPMNARTLGSRMSDVLFSCRFRSAPPRAAAMARCSQGVVRSVALSPSLCAILNVATVTGATRSDGPAGRAQGGPAVRARDGPAGSATRALRLQTPFRRGRASPGRAAGAPASRRSPQAATVAGIS